MKEASEAQTLQPVDGLAHQERTDDSEVLVRVENLSKKFCRNLKRSLWYGVQDMTGEVLGRSKKDILRKDEFWAVKDVNFELRRGECLGLIGHNGAGKSTLLKMLNGLIKPDQGRIEMNGRVGALIELGAGFNPVLTGRENVYINGQILGFSKKEIDEKYEAIVEFAEIPDFMESPVQSYSSGMKVRLGFAIAAQMEPDILIIDEVLAVGDVGFQGKCLTAISNLLKNACVIFVSHSMPQVNRYCNKCAHIEHGRGFKILQPLDAIDAYHKKFKKESGNVFKLKDCDIKYASINNTELSRNITTNITYNSYIKFNIKGVIEHERYPRFIIHFLNRDLQIIASSLSPEKFIKKDKSLIEVEVCIGPIILNPGEYKISIGILSSNLVKSLVYYNAWWTVKISGEKPDFGANYIRFQSQWKY